MARIENHYNILMLVIEYGDIPAIDSAAATIPMSLIIEYLETLFDSNNLLIPCLRIENGSDSAYQFNVLSTYYLNSNTTERLQFKNNDDNIFNVRAQDLM